MGKKQITDVAPDSPAARAGICPGEWLVSLNDHDILDALDYRFFGAEEKCRIEIENKAGEIRKLTLDNEGYEDLGLTFETYLMDRHRSCCNKCKFCFVDQLPPGMRESLYFKDDDERLSLLFGNYVTLTNLSERAFCRIIDLHISPINVSVHATDPAVRCDLMGNRLAGDIMDKLRRLCDAGIELNCQLVICPGYNDGEILKKSIEELLSLGENIRSVAVIPLGMTDHREGLAKLEPVTKQNAAAVCELCARFSAECRKTRGIDTVYVADEFYLKADLPLPPCESYGDFPQLDNGVGMMAKTEKEFTDALSQRHFSLFSKKQTVTVVTGMAAKTYMERLCTLAQRASHGKLILKTIAVENDFFGHSVDVSGLLTGQDIQKRLAGENLGCRVVIPGNALKRDEDIFLDDMKLTELEKALGVPTLHSGQTGGDLLAAICGERLPR